MGKVTVFTGQAGTGKTTALMNLLAEVVPKRDWLDFETILALTFMHGSRKRLDAKLAFLKTDFKIKFKCSTIDSFSVNLVNRFKSYLNIDKPIKVNTGNENIEGQYEIQLPLESMQKHMIAILEHESVKKFIANSFPYILIDEFQDCTGNLLEIVKRLSLSTDLLIAADPFQQLTNDESSEGMDWIIENQFEHFNLDEGGVKRTKNDNILNTAACLRTGKNVNGKKVFVGISVAKQLTTAFLLPNIHYNIKGGTIAIITPTKKGKFIADAMNSLSGEYTFKKGYHKGKTIGPYDRLLSSDEYIDIEALIHEIPKQPLTKTELNKLKTNRNFVLKRVAEMLLRKLSLRNIDHITYEEFHFLVEQLSHTYDNFYRKESHAKIIFTTIHGAKNREFETVIILWPYEAAGNLVYKRKLLYNAITRAKTNAMIIVQREKMKYEDLAKDELFSLIYDLPE